MAQWLVRQSFRTQVAVVCAATLAVVAVAAILVRDALSQAESRLLAEARRQCEAACQELAEQYRERAALGGDALETLPARAQDLSLRGLSLTVLRAYDGMRGGYYRDESGGVVGQAGSPGVAEDLGPHDRELLVSAVRLAEAGPAVVTGVRGGDLVVAAARKLEGSGGAAWALKRVAWSRSAAGWRMGLWYGALALSALLGIGAVAGIWLALRAGVARVSAGLRRLEEDFNYRLPLIGGEFGEIAHAVNRMADRRRALEEELRRQERLAALGKAAAGVAHEIRNPLNSLKLTLELLERRLRKGTATGEEIRAAIAEIDRLDAILGRLLAFGRPALTDRREQDVGALVQQAAAMVREQAQRKRVRIALPEGRGDLRADVDGPQIIQVLINLLLNAIAASPEGGEVEVKAGRSGERVWLTVTDYGPGIPEGVRPHIFEAFFTTRPEGSGLGLAVSREIVAGHGGTLEFDPSAPGTTFRVTLPVRRQAS